MELDENYFGSKKQRKEYKILLYIGFGVICISAPLASIGFYNNLNIKGTDILSIIGSVLLFIGSMCAVSGWLGLREERKKYGIKRVSTPTGVAALIFGILSVFLPQAYPFPFILGEISIVFAYKSVKQGDNVYGRVGGICGAVGIIVGLYVWILFTFF